MQRESRRVDAEVTGRRVPFGDVVFARSGDKGGDANLGGVGPRRPRGPGRVAAHVPTPDRVARPAAGDGRPRGRGVRRCPTSAPSTSSSTVCSARASRRRRASTRRPRRSASGCGRGSSTSRRSCCELAARSPTEQRRAADELRARFVEREVRAAPAGLGGRRRGAARAARDRPRSSGCSASASPRTLGGAGGTFLDALAVTEAFTEAGASSGLLAALFTSGIALPHIVASGNADLVDRFVRPTLAGETIGSLAVTEPGGGSDVARIRTTARRATATPTSSTAPRPSSPPASAPTS